jgi:hypothetical protein
MGTDSPKQSEITAILFQPCFVSYFFPQSTVHRASTLYKSKVHGSGHRDNILIYIQHNATLHILFYLKTALHVSGGTTTYHQERKQLYLQHLVFVTPLLLPAGYYHPSSGAQTTQTTVSTASGICHIVIATCR